MKKRLAENIKEEHILPLKQQEIDLIYVLRNVYRYGNVEIVMRDGVPYDLIRTIERTRLGTLSTDDVG
jgi:hypothetical protein